MVTKLVIFSLIATTAFFQMYFLRKVIAECKKHNIEPPGAFNFWRVIDNIWKESKNPGKEKLKSGLIKLLISWISFFVCFGLLAAKMNP